MISNLETSHGKLLKSNMQMTNQLLTSVYKLKNLGDSFYEFPG